MEGLKDDATMKRCNRCKKWLDRRRYQQMSEMRPHVQGTFGYADTCKTCVGKAERRSPWRYAHLGSKRCTGCLYVLPLTSFSFNESTLDGRSLVCRKCSNERVKASYRKHHQPEYMKLPKVVEPKLPRCSVFKCRYKARFKLTKPDGTVVPRCKKHLQSAKFYRRNQDGPPRRREAPPLISSDELTIHEETQ